MNEELQKKIEEFEKEHNAKVLYITKYGSKLYGTDNPNSDLDLKGIFVQKPDTILLKKDIEHWTSNSNNTNQKNGADDIDLQLFSLNKFFTLLRKGETGVLDVLFSMWSNVIVFEDKEFTTDIKDNYKSFLNRRLHSFTGYAVGQAKKYGIKGTRYKELVNFIENFEAEYVMSSSVDGSKSANQHIPDRLETMFSTFEEYLDENKPKYISFVEAPGPKTGKGENLITYIEILGKKFSGDITISRFFTLIVEMINQFGNRTRSSAEGTNPKLVEELKGLRDIL